MARFLKAVSPKGDVLGRGAWLARFLVKGGRTAARIDHLSERMLRDVGLSDQEIARLERDRRRPGPGVR